MKDETENPKNSKVGNIFIGNQIAFWLERKLETGTVMGFGYTVGLKPYLQIAESPKMQVLVPQVEKIVNRGKR